MHRAYPGSTMPEPITNTSDTSTPYGNEEMTCKHCGYSIGWCICHTDFVDFLDDKFEKEQLKLIPKKVTSYIYNTQPTTIPIRKNLHSLSGCNGLKLLKKKDKR